MTKRDLNAEELFQAGVDAVTAGDLRTAGTQFEQCLRVCDEGSPLKAATAQNLAAVLGRWYDAGECDASRDTGIALAVRLVQLCELVAIPALHDMELMLGRILEDLFRRWNVVADLRAANDLF